ncbi:hypothetical protein BCR35DRAFT_301818 [Leucosporidium creatinivorum]|uniref:Uncharacterized protein n=1 Tax=Leucosporidium creatinivorum TaxID=106004 RepID=A0A1Y2FYL4_9BASI|nr:hypothetical protein BCR35DRAFT_301818 [Leucosporidium creatinivorum]
MSNNRRNRRPAQGVRSSQPSPSSQPEIVMSGYAEVMDPPPPPPAYKASPSPSPAIPMTLVPFHKVRLGVDPASLKGKHLARVHRSESHPFYHLAFTDGTQYKIHLEDYEPGKALELTSTPGFAEKMEPFLDADWEGRRANPALIENCSFGVLKDKELRKRGLHRFTEHHALVLKIEGINTCVWGSFRMPEEQPDRWPGRTLHTPFLVQLDWRGKEIPRAEDEGDDVYSERWE